MLFPWIPSGWRHNLLWQNTLFPLETAPTVNLWEAPLQSGLCDDAGGKGPRYLTYFKVRLPVQVGCFNVTHCLRFTKEREKTKQPSWIRSTPALHGWQSLTTETLLTDPHGGVRIDHSRSSDWLGRQTDTPVQWSTHKDPTQQHLTPRGQK